MSGDGFESNNTCNTASSLGTLGTSGSQTDVDVTPTIYGSGDLDVFRVDWTETDSSCGCGGVFDTDEDYSLTATLTVPPGAGSYRVCGLINSCGIGNDCVTVSAGSTGSITIWQDDCCSPIGCDGSGTGFFTIQGVGAPAFACDPYELSVRTGIGCR